MYENPSEVRELIQQGKLIRPTAGTHRAKTRRSRVIRSGFRAPNWLKL